MCLDCEYGRGGGGGGVLKVGEGAGSSQAGGIVFYLLDWKTFQRKCVGGYVEECQTTALNSKASHRIADMTLVNCAFVMEFLNVLL